MREVRKSLVVVSWGKVSKGESPSTTGFWLLAASDFFLAGPILASEIEHKEGKNARKVRTARWKSTYRSRFILGSSITSLSTRWGTGSTDVVN